MLSLLRKRFIKKNTKQFAVKKYSRIVEAYQFKMLCIILNKVSVTSRKLYKKMKTFLGFFVLFPDNEFLIEKSWFLLVRI